MLRLATRALAAICLIAPAAAFAESGAIRVELNAAETADKRCRLTYVVENKAAAITSLKLDLAMFNTDGAVYHRMITEMGPLRAAKTVVRTFSHEGDCARVSAVLVNDVTCAPGTPDSCIEGLSLSSRLKTIKFYK